MHGPKLIGEIGFDVESQSAVAATDQIRLDKAVNGLRRKWPAASAASPLARWQRWLPLSFLAVGAMIAVGSHSVRSGLALEVVSLVLAVPFLMIGVIRILAIYHLVCPPPRSLPSISAQPRSSQPLFRSGLDQLAFVDAGTPAAADPDGAQPAVVLPAVVLPDMMLPAVVPCEVWPAYTVLVPLYNESAVAHSIVGALAALDYPPDRIDIMFLTECSDHATRAALQAEPMTAAMRIIIVPDGAPRTKPRALNYGLQLAHGDLVCIFDAEDIPDPQQLKIAATRFHCGGPDLACLQARLSIYNPTATFWTEQFTIEYAALFEAVLPAMDRFRLPLPLAGTSNHFRIQPLLDAGGWDPFNVTEDADLGYRFARLGYRVATILSVTAEEAPQCWRVWRGQRTRWLKGWMQTYLVHMREPKRLWRELGPSGFVAFQVTLGGMVLSALVHPWVYLGLAMAVATGYVSWASDNTIVVTLMLINVIVGYVAGIVLAVLALNHRGLSRLATAALLIPVYWLAISFAAYRALIELVQRPHHWEKTPHGRHHETAGPFVT